MENNLSYILRLRNSLQSELRNMPLFQNGSAIIVVNNEGKILLQHRTDRDQWGTPGGLQELGETFEQVALRELNEETGLVANINDLRLIGVVSGESRKNSYPNGDVVYNNTVLYSVNKYTGELGSNYEEVIDKGNGYFESVKESRGLQFFDLNQLPENLMDRDLINLYKSLGKTAILA